MKKNKENNFFVGVKFNQNVDLFNKLNKHPKSNSSLIRESVKLWFNQQKETGKTTSMEDIFTDDILNECYSMFYNQEIIPLQAKIKHKTEIIDMLKTDKAYLKNQVDNLMLGKNIR